MLRHFAIVLISYIFSLYINKLFILASRCVDREQRDKLVAEVGWYDRYLEIGRVDRDANPSPGNKEGGLSNIVEKAMGSIAKSGTASISEVIGPGEKPTKHGLICACTPASDIVCGPSQVASGIGLQVFMTGRGTPYGLEIAPVVTSSPTCRGRGFLFDSSNELSSELLPHNRLSPSAPRFFFYLI
ncbi:UxaA family hydrolase [Succinivibrio dextrinosolvens]|uniref:UxaA family hydrolase n=1 Tax=Succinivibrio dextrinosolvens TaxID=83771 RepID=UPI00247A9157|nr:UxaA family hydrolase [Succinivibrio dextrinosolvens]